MNITGQTILGIVMCFLLNDTVSAQGEREIVLIQQSDHNLRGESTSPPTIQHISVRGEKIKIYEPQSNFALYIDLETQVVKEANIRLKQYVQRSLTEYQVLKDLRQRYLDGQVDIYKTGLARLKKKTSKRRQWKLRFQRLGVDTDHPGRIKARVQHHPRDRKSHALIFNGEFTALKLTHYQIRENQAAKPVLDLWVTTDINTGVHVLDFFTAIFPFGDEVLEQVKKIRGMVIFCDVFFDIGLLQKTMKTKVLMVSTKEKIKSDSVRLPASWSNVTRVARVSSLPGEVTCAYCRKAIRQNKSLRFREPYNDKKLYHYCSARHRSNHIKTMYKTKKKNRR